jgi:hypothetical protein
MYILLFTCLVTRAVHLEVCPDMTTASVVNAISRFCDRRGVPTTFFSDGQTSFVACNEVLAEIFDKLDWSKVQQFTAHGFKQSSGIDWKFGTPTASHFGGVWEILVKAVKRAMSAIYGYQDMYHDEFLTAVSSVEALLNSRPLTVANVSSLAPTVLTPNHFLVGMAGGDMCPASNADPSRLCHRWKLVKELQRQFWQRFMNEIVPALHPRKKWKNEMDNLRPGGLVLEIDPDLPKGLWKLAKIEEVQPSLDDKI